MKENNNTDLGYTPLNPILGGHGGYLCGYQHSILPLENIIAVGFGMATLTKDNEVIYDENEVDDAKGFDSYMTVKQAEEIAAKDPKHDWRIHLVAPLSERHYQRQGENKWVLYEKGQGFA